MDSSLTATELEGITTSDSVNFQLQSMPMQETCPAQSENGIDPSKEKTANEKPQDPSSLQGAHLIFLLSCLFLGNFTIGFVGILIEQNELH